MQKTKHSYDQFVKLSLEERKRLYVKQKTRRPNYIPTILYKLKKSVLPDITECRMLLPQNFLVLQFKEEVRKLLNKTRPMEKEAIFLAHGNHILNEATTLKQVYERQCANKQGTDGWFYVAINNLDTF